MVYNNLFIVEAYAPCEGSSVDEFYEYLHAHVLEAEARKLRIIIMGDLNGHIAGRYHTETNYNGQELLDFTYQWNLNLLPNSHWTFRGRHGEPSLVDYTMISQEISTYVTKHHVSPDLQYSDHIPLITYVEPTPNMTIQPQKKRI